MPQIETAYFGSLAWEPGSAIEFPAGLPGFEDERRFLPIEIREYAPLVFLQSIRTPGLCFLTLPVLAADPEYRLEAAPEDLARIGLDPRRPPVIGPTIGPAIGKDVLCLAILTVAEAGITANLLAPLLIALDSRRGVQAIDPQGRYSHRHPLACEEAAVCS